MRALIVACFLFAGCSSRSDAPGVLGHRAALVDGGGASTPPSDGAVIESSGWSTGSRVAIARAGEVLLVVRSGDSQSPAQLRRYSLDGVPLDSTPRTFASGASCRVASNGQRFVVVCMGGTNSTFQAYDLRARLVDVDGTVTELPNRLLSLGDDAFAAAFDQAFVGAVGEDFVVVTSRTRTGVKMFEAYPGIYAARIGPDGAVTSVWGPTGAPSASWGYPLQAAAIRSSGTLVSFGWTFVAGPGGGPAWPPSEPTGPTVTNVLARLDPSFAEGRGTSSSCMSNVSADDGTGFLFLREQGGTVVGCRTDAAGVSVGGTFPVLDAGAGTVQTVHALAAGDDVVAIGHEIATSSSLARWHYRWIGADGSRHGSADRTFPTAGFWGSSATALDDGRIVHATVDGTRVWLRFLDRDGSANEQGDAGVPGTECDVPDRCGDPGQSHVCLPSDVSYVCACATGYERSSVSGPETCLDVDECASPTRCGADSTRYDVDCTNLPGSYACTCGPGFVVDPASPVGSCLDVDECATIAGVCAGLGACENRLGGFACSGCGAGSTAIRVGGVTSCVCIEGSEPSATGCVDVDECAAAPDLCGPNANCINRWASFSCACRSGFWPLQPDGGGCPDVDECAQNPVRCGPNAICTNRPGTFECACLAGYETGSPGCKDVDECARHLDECAPAATCTNTPGAYTCACAPGYEGDGRSCELVALTCEPGFEQSFTSCVDVDECGRQAGPCGDHATCTNTIGAYVCACDSGHHAEAGVCVPGNPSSPDAGVDHDAGVVADAGASGDAGNEPDASLDDAGVTEPRPSDAGTSPVDAGRPKRDHDDSVFGCSVGGSHGGDSSVLAVAGLLVSALVVRRRHRR